MLFNLATHIDRERFKRRSNDLFRKGGIVEVTEKTHRTTSQNAYLHLIIGHMALETGNTLEYVKREYFKITCNPEFFITSKHDPILDMTLQTLRSSAELTSAEMTIAIDRFRDWSAANGIYLPEAREREFLDEIQVETDRNKKYL